MLFAVFGLAQSCAVLHLAEEFNVHTTDFCKHNLVAAGSCRRDQLAAARPAAAAARCSSAAAAASCSAPPDEATSACATLSLQCRVSKWQQAEHGSQRQQSTEHAGCSVCGQQLHTPGWRGAACSAPYHTDLSSCAAARRAATSSWSVCSSVCRACRQVAWKAAQQGMGLAGWPVQRFGALSHLVGSE